MHRSQNTIMVLLLLRNEEKTVSTSKIFASTKGKFYNFAHAYYSRQNIPKRCLMTDLTIKVKYRIGDVVYSRSDNEGRVRFVTGYIIRKGVVIYIISLDGMETFYYDFELLGENEQLLGLN